MLSILQVAAENGSLRGGKVGGEADVVRDASLALAKAGFRVCTVMPSYGFLHKLPQAQLQASIEFEFAGEKQAAQIYVVPGDEDHPNLTHFVIDHPSFVSYDEELGRHQIYVTDPQGRPFASDATKFACFSVTVAQAISNGVFGSIDYIHLHDWHTAFFFVLRTYNSHYRSLERLHTVFTVHNSALQGIRPFDGDVSSLKAWYPGLTIDQSKLADSRLDHCINPMAVGIRYADKVHVVSPTYAEEILLPSDKPSYYGGEGLEVDFTKAKQEGRLIGILNGCEYGVTPVKLDFNDLVNLLMRQVIRWVGVQRNVQSPHFVTYTRLIEAYSRSNRPPIILTSVSRAVEQKMFLMRREGSNSKSGLQTILEQLGSQGIFFMLGSGDPQYERFLTEMSSKYNNFIFLNGYSDECADALYSNGDLFLMCSSWEPCGLSQMLAMRAGQPCVVHAVGGLKDTVIDGINGFSFDGHTATQQVDNFVTICLNAIQLKLTDPTKWEELRQHAFESRFFWKDSVAEYTNKLYT